MALKCLECGCVFEDGEQAVWEERHGLDNPPYEKFSGCPICCGDYVETKPCANCENEYTEDELYEGWCEECLREQITYESFLGYCEANKDEHYLDAFVMSELLGGMDCPRWISYDFHQLMVDTYMRRVEKAKLYPLEDFLESCIRFVMEDDGSVGRDNFANWLNRREVK